MAEERAFTVRIPEAQARDLETIAAVQGHSLAEEVRRAIRREIDERRHDPAFQARLKWAIEENQAQLRRLSAFAGD